MTKAQELLLLHLWLIGYIYIVVATLRGKMSEKNYQTNGRTSRPTCDSSVR